MAQDYNSRENKNAQEDKNRSEKKCVWRYWPGAILILALLLVALLLRLASSRPEPPVECVMGKDAQDIPQGRLDPTRSFIDNQVIVTGPESKVRRVLEELADFELKPIQECRLNYLGESSPQTERQPPYLFSDAERRELTTNLYYIPDGRSVEEVVEAINQVGQDSHVFADPNLLTGLPLSICGNPDHTSGGSPYGSPELLPVGEEAAVKQFWEQWAFRQAGVGPSFKNTLVGTAILHQGEGTLVGVFDTSPFLDPWDGAANEAGVETIETQEIVKWVNPTMDVEPLALKVLYPTLVNTLTVTVADRTVTGQITAVDVRDHGLFVAGLIHAVAPASEIRLVRVLNEYGCGGLFTLKIALDNFVSEVARERGTLQGVVINLSLGTPNPDAEESTILHECESGSFGDEIVSLCTTLREAQNKGAVIVAAAGNEAGAAQIPAAFDFIIGVQASNRANQRASFSNEGDVSAPGGDGNLKCSCNEDVASAPGGDERLSGDKPSESRISQCSSDCAEAIVGPVLFPPQGKAYWPTHYGYWNGTSFSAPLVSGLAALALQGGATPAEGSDLSAFGWAPPDRVFEVIRCGASASNDVINVPATLTDCLP